MNMLEEKINENLRELENSLNNLESARNQVERTVRAYGELQSNTQSYLHALAQITSEVQTLINTVGQDYRERITSFEKDRNTIIESTNAIIDKLNDEYKTTWKKISRRQVLFVSITILLLIAVLLLLLKQSF